MSYFQPFSASSHSRNVFIFIAISYVGCARRWMYVECGVVHKRNSKQAVTRQACQYLGPQSIHLLSTLQCVCLSLLPALHNLV